MLCCVVLATLQSRSFSPLACFLVYTDLLVSLKTASWLPLLAFVLPSSALSLFFAFFTLAFFFGIAPAGSACIDLLVLVLFQRLAWLLFFFTMSSSSDILSQVHFRTVSPTDIPACFEIEQESYPADEAASKSSLQYRQHHAAPYFRCAVLGDEDSGKIVGYICSTRCREFTAHAMNIHDTSGPLLAIHSVVVQQDYRHQGIAKAMMKDYIQAMQEMNDGVDKLVLLAKSNLLGFYVQCGFSVVKPSSIVHGQDVWYDCELTLEGSQDQGYPCWILDSFADKAGSGNPAAIVLLPSGTDVEEQETIAWMEMVAKEFNLAETAFMWPKDDIEKEQEEILEKEGDSHSENSGSVKRETMDSGRFASYYIRYFTSNGTQVDLCGHATLASAAILFQTRFKGRHDAEVVFEANKDVLKVTPYLEGRKASSDRPNKCTKAKMDFPRKALEELTVASDRSSALNMLKTAFGMPEISDHVLFLGLDEDGGDLLVELTREGFLSIGYDNVNYYSLLEWDGYSRGVMLCCREEPPVVDEEQEQEGSDSGEEVVVDFLSRFFGPKAGINEDPVTGSAHCTLAPFYANKLNKTNLIGKQMSERGGIVECIVEEDRVSIIGTAITTVRGSLFI